MRYLLAAVSFVAVSSGISAADISADTVSAVKRASVYIRSQIGAAKATGSGFVIATADGALLVATNSHVVLRDEDARLAPSKLLDRTKLIRTTVTFDSGSPTEQTATAEIVAIDPTVDLAVLRVKAADVKNPPKALALALRKPLVETATVYTFGYPFGDAIANGKSPSATVGKASISSLRTDDAGKLASVQIDGNLNPGNSGGPVVDTDGDVIGVATSIIRDGRGIGFAVPAAEVAAMLDGKVCSVRTEYSKQPDGKVKVAVEALVANPRASLTGVKLHYAPAAAAAEPPKSAGQIAKLPDAVALPLKLNGWLATGEFVLDRTTGQLFYAAETVGPKETLATAVVGIGIARALLGQGVDADAKPPVGWKQIEFSNGFITVWVPEKSGKPAESNRTLRNGISSIRIRVTGVAADNGVNYTVEMASLVPPLPIRTDTAKIRDAIAQSEADSLRGKIVEESDAKLGTWPCREYVVRSGDRATVLRILVSHVNIYILKATGPAKQIQGDDGVVFVNSFRAHPRDPGTTAKTPTPGETTPPPINEKPAAPKPGVETEIVGAGNDPAFKDFGSDGAYLVGFEIVENPQNRLAPITGLRPIFRIGEKESFGDPHGATDGAKTIKAKPGFAVSSVTVQRAPRGIQALSIAFAKLDGGKLLPNERYESEWVGSKSMQPITSLDSNAVPFIGIAGRENSKSKQISGLGLIPESPDATALRREWLAGAPTEVLGVSFDPTRREIGPDGSLLVGLELGLEKSRDASVIRSVKPIFRAGETESAGKQFGKDQPETVKLIAKPGYAVGAINTKVVLAVDGLSVTFMKVVDGKLDPKDKYESEWIGPDRGRAVTIGDGSPVVGLVGREGGFKTCSGFGLLLKKSPRE